MQDTIHISGLEPLIAPEPVGFWPPAPGWYLLTGLLLLALFLFLISLIRKRKSSRYRRVALNQLKEIVSVAENHPGQGDVRTLNRLLKQTALSTYPREQVASLSGMEWLEFLDQSCAFTQFTDLPGKHLSDITYRKEQDVNVPLDQWNQLIEEAGTWIRKHVRA